MPDWKPIDTASLEESLNIRSTAETEGGFNEPASDSNIFSTTELQVKDFIEDHYTSHYDTVLNNHFTGIESTILRSEALTMADGHAGQISEIKIKADFLITGLKATIKPFAEKRDFEADNLRGFKLSNQLVRPAIVKSASLKFWLVILVFFMFLFETSGNTFLLTGAITGGVLGAVSFASIISFINIVLSFMAGRMVVPQLNHVKKSKNNFAKLILCIYAPVIIYFNFAMGVFRSISQSQETTFTTATLQDAAVQSVFPFSNIDVLTIASIGLIAIGLIFAIISLVDGYNFDDPYPDYGDVNKRALLAEDNFTRECQNALKDLSSHLQQAQDQITTLKTSRLEANVNWGLCVDRIQDGFIDYREWTARLISSGTSLIQRYRSVNSKFRISPDPAFFNEDISFAIETNPEIRIANLSAHHMSDNEKNNVIKENNDVITKEYNDGQLEISKCFEDRNSKLEDYIQSLG